MPKAVGKSRDTTTKAQLEVPDYAEKFVPPKKFIQGGLRQVRRLRVNMCVVRVANPEEVPLVEQFYHESKYLGGIQTSDTLVIAEDEGQIIAAVRLCQEQGELVLRGMRVKEDLRGQGIGSRL